jgi:DivIVA domain-containing protein
LTSLEPRAAVELTAGILRDVQFRQSWKGYDTVEVDDFLDSVATGVAQLHERLAVAQERAVIGLQAAAQAPAPARSESDESVRRTLVLAQRAADLVVSEAKSVADRIVADAHSEASAITGASRAVADQTELQARSRAEQILSEASAMAERQTATRAAELQSSLEHLVEEQGRKRFELEQLRSQVESYRAQLRSELEAQMRRLEAVPEPPQLVDLITGETSAQHFPPHVQPLQKPEHHDRRDVPDSGGSFPSG